MTVGIFPNVSFMSQNRAENSAQSAHSRTGRLRNKSTKGRRRVVTKVQLLFLKMYDSWVAYFTTQSRRNLYRFDGRAQKSWDKFVENRAQRCEYHKLAVFLVGGGGECGLAC